MLIIITVVDSGEITFDAEDESCADIVGIEF